jgi:hypothetical protein
VLRLWPDRVVVGMFDSHTWVADWKGRPLSPSSPQREDAPDVSNAPLEVILDRFSDAIPRGADVLLLVSDSLASLIALPWQSGLRRPAELTRYAQLCFERAGLDVAGKSVLHAEFHHFGRLGLAYAFPRELVLQNESICRHRGVRLARILPASAAAYFSPRAGRGSGLSVWLLGEERRVTALVHDAAGLRAYEVEPASPARDIASTRLLRKARALYGEASTIALWTPFAAEFQELMFSIKHEYPEININLLQRQELRI